MKKYICIRVLFGILSGRLISLLSLVGNHLFVSVWTQGYLFYTLRRNLTLFCGSNCSSFAQRGLFVLAPLLICKTLVSRSCCCSCCWRPPYFLAQPRACLAHFLPPPRISPLSKRLWFPLLVKGGGNHDLGTRWAHWTKVLFSF